MDTVDNYFLLDRLENLGIIDSTCQTQSRETVNSNTSEVLYRVPLGSV